VFKKTKQKEALGQFEDDVVASILMILPNNAVVWVLVAHASHGLDVCCMWPACPLHALACTWHVPGMCLIS